jgi:hypothetical protein
MAELSKQGSQIFMDAICTSEPTKTIPNGQDWAITSEEIPESFALTGWEVSSSYVNKYDPSRNIGQRGMIFIQGIKK